MEATGAQSGPWTVNRLLAWTREHLQRQGVESARLCAEILLAHAMKCERIQLYTQFDAVPSAEVLAPFRAAVREAAAGRPIAHLTGAKEFFSLTFEVTPDVLIPRPETEVLVERTIDLVRRANGMLRSILDLGTGSGCIAVSLAKLLPDVGVYASDISEAVLAVARRNAERHGIATRIRFASGDLFAAWPPTGAAAEGGAAVPPFDVIVSNPPYLSTAPGTPVAPGIRQYEPYLALFAGVDGLDVIRRIVAEAPARLRPGGHLLLEVAFDQAGRVRELFNPLSWQEIVGYRDGGGHERVVHARRRAVGPA
jgi:release factor glutamine methyltransferase